MSGVSPMTDAELVRILGGEPRFDLCPGPASKRLLYDYCWKTMAQSVGKEGTMAISLLGGFLPPIFRKVQSEVAHLRGKSDAELKRMAEAEAKAAG
ncbi:hypothetical protein [Ruegeria lacuscaerulensis]|uniref:hypothetical protein n=1 Tax=Ruegeria lacuscaerulensis TaxID=55218 RepID=UPI00147D6039|nr:hypothetical protein [Ruegeria lacuscaerulensis]